MNGPIHYVQHDTSSPLQFSTCVGRMYCSSKSTPLDQAYIFQTLHHTPSKGHEHIGSHLFDGMGWLNIFTWTTDPLYHLTCAVPWRYLCPHSSVESENFYSSITRP